MQINILANVLVAVLAFFHPAAPANSAAPDEADILARIDAFFLALHSGDPEAFDELMQPHARVVYVGPGEAAGRFGLSEGRASSRRMREGDHVGFEEAYWSPTVMQRGDLAMVWTPYILYRGADFSHCGIDQFSMTRRAGRWVIDFASFTIEPSKEACAALGYPRDGEGLRPDFGETTAGRVLSQ